MGESVWQENTGVRFWERNMRTVLSVVIVTRLWCQKEIWIGLTAWLSLIPWEEPGWRVVEGHSSVLCLCHFFCYQQSLVCILEWIQGCSKFMSFGGPCSDSRVTSVTSDQTVKPSQCTYQKKGGDAQHSIRLCNFSGVPRGHQAIQNYRTEVVFLLALIFTSSRLALVASQLSWLDPSPISAARATWQLKKHPTPLCCCWGF